MPITFCRPFLRKLLHLHHPIGMSISSNETQTNTSRLDIIEVLCTLVLFIDLAIFVCQVISHLKYLRNLKGSTWQSHNYLLVIFQVVGKLESIWKASFYCRYFISGLKTYTMFDVTEIVRLCHNADRLGTCRMERRRLKRMLI